MKRVLILLLLVIIAGAIGFACHSGVKTRYVIADGFRGKFAIMQNQPNGEDLPCEDGVYAYHIPRSKLLKLKDSNPALDRAQFPEAVYESGYETLQL